MIVCKGKYVPNNFYIIGIVITILHFPLTTSAHPRDPGWARFCGLTKDQQYVSQDFFTDQCPGGVWLNSSANQAQWNCLCTMGSFALRFNWCTAEQSITGLGSNGLARFTTSDITCVHFGQEKLQGLQTLHKWSNRYKEDGPYILTKESGGALLSQKDLRSVRIKNMTLTSGLSTLFAIRANPKANTYYSIYSRKTSRAVCLLPPNGTEVIGGLYSYKINFLWSPNEKAPSQKSSSVRRIPKHVKLEFVSKPGCFFTDRTYSFKAIQPENMDEYVLPKLNPPELHPDCLKCLSDQSPFIEPSTVEAPYAADLDNVTNLNKEVDLQSQRLAIRWGDISLRNRSNPHEMKSIQEVEILRKAAIMAYGACDMNYIPKQFYQFFLVLFQALLSESFLKYPPQAPMEDKVYEEVSVVLDTCMQKTEVYSITVENTCPPTYSEHNEPGVGYEPIETPVELMATPNKHDYVLEFAWKLISFLHYHCFDEFKNSPFLHDMLQVQLENLFQPDLLLRWSHPSNSLKMLESIFKIHLDVVVTMINFEKCVSVANKKNKFEGWLKKPLNQPNGSKNVRRRKRSAPRTNRAPKGPQTADRFIRRRRQPMIIETVPIQSLDYKNTRESTTETTIATTFPTITRSPITKLRVPTKSPFNPKPASKFLPRQGMRNIDNTRNKPVPGQSSVRSQSPVAGRNDNQIHPGVSIQTKGRPIKLDSQAVENKRPKRLLLASSTDPLKEKSESGHLSETKIDSVSTEPSFGMKVEENSDKTVAAMEHVSTEIPTDKSDSVELSELLDYVGPNAASNALHEESGAEVLSTPIMDPIMENGLLRSLALRSREADIPEDENILGNLNGGTRLTWMDEGSKSDSSGRVQEEDDGISELPSDLPILDMGAEKEVKKSRAKINSQGMTPKKKGDNDNSGDMPKSDVTDEKNAKVSTATGQAPDDVDLPFLDVMDEEDRNHYSETGSKPTNRPGGGGPRGGGVYQGSKPLADFPDDVAPAGGGVGQGGGGVYQGSKPLTDFPDDDAAGGGGGEDGGGSLPDDADIPVLDIIDGAEEPDNDAARPGGGGDGGGGGGGDGGSVGGGRGYHGSKPLLDFPDENTPSVGGGGGGYHGSKPLMDFPEEENYNKEKMGHFRGAFACLYSITDFAAQNSEYPLYNDVCWD